MTSNPRKLERTAPSPNTGPGLSARILRLVKSAPERQAIDSGQVDAVIDASTGTAFLLPDAQRALRDDQTRIRSLLALSTDWCWEQDEFYRFVSHTGAGSGSSGIYDENIIGKTLRDPPFDSLSEADWQTHQRLLEWRATFRDLELKCTDRTGGMRWVSVSGEPTFDGQDQFTGYRGTMRDVTLRKQSEAAAQIALQENVTERTRGDQRVEPIPGKVGAHPAAARDDIAGRKRKEQSLEPSRKVTKGEPIANGLLAALPRKDYLGLLAGLELVKLNYGEILFEPGETIRHIYFPNDCLVSLLTAVEGHDALEVGLVGREGMVGVSLALGISVSSVRALVQGTGTAMRMTAARFRKELSKNLPLQREVYRFTHAKLAQARQTAACNRFHVVEARLARWLLMTRDRLRSDHFLLTQEFLADMLGVLRVAVSQAAGALQQRKLIGYSRGKIRILDGKGLEAVSCQCYEAIKDL